MGITIRTENTRDYAAIAALTQEAFEINFLDGNKPARFLGEVGLVDHLRSLEGFDPELSLVAEIDGRLAGHIMFVPYRQRLYRAVLNPACLQIVSVPPPFQRRGVGTALIAEGLARSAAKGHPYSFLLGHDSYYPRFGFLTGTFGEAAIEVAQRDFTPAALEEVAVQAFQLEALAGMHEATFDGIPLASPAPERLLGWKSISPFVTSAILMDGARPLAYIRRCELGGRPLVKAFAATSPVDASRAISHLFSLYPGSESLSLPLHPASPILRGLPFTGKVDPWSAGMIKVLDDSCAPIKRYHEGVARDPSSAGQVLWPCFFDLI